MQQRKVLFVLRFGRQLKKSYDRHTVRFFIYLFILSTKLFIYLYWVLNYWTKKNNVQKET